VDVGDFDGVYFWVLGGQMGWDWMDRIDVTFSDPQFARRFERARGVFGQVLEDDRGGHCHGEGGGGDVLVGLCCFWWG
jgi:hypothetical protein